MMHDYINRRVKHILDGCSMLSGMLFQLNWNTVPTYLEQGYILAITMRELKKLTTRAYRMRKWCWWAMVYNLSATCSPVIVRDLLKIALKRLIKKLPSMRTAILTEGKLFFDMALDIIKKAQGWAHPLSRGSKFFRTCIRMHVTMSVIVLQR